MPCDHCPTYHQLGYDLCPACQGGRTPTDPAPRTRDALLQDLAEQLAHALHEGQVSLAQVRVWLTLLQQARQPTQ